MRRPLALALLAAVAATAAGATPDRPTEDPSALVAAEGLEGAEALLAALPAPTASDAFALGAVRVLRGVERALQLRYRVGLSDGLAVLSGLPVLRLPLPENPAPDPFEASMIAALFADVEGDMAGALDALRGIGDADEVAVTVRTEDLWFDIDADGARGPGEGFMDVAGLVLDPGFGFEGAAPAPVTIRFDTADAAWLAAYAHLLSATAETVQAFDPTEAIARVQAAREGFEALGTPALAYDFSLGSEFGDVADLLAMAVFALEGQPDPARTRAARDHLLLMIAENRRFWRLVVLEADNEAEWIPNKRQQSATGLPFPPETGPMWLAVLDDAEAVLTGERLVPHWRLGEGAGVDVSMLLEDPPPVDILGLVQGEGLLPFMRRGPLADGRAMALFASMMRGEALLYAVVLN